VREFRPRSEGDADYSAAITSFIKYKGNWIGGKGGGAPGMMAGQPGMMAGQPQFAQQQFAQQGAGMQQGAPAGGFQRPAGMPNPNAAWASAEIDPYAAPVDLESFRAQYPMDDRAWDFIQNVDQRVQRRIVETFKPHREGEADYSAKITSYVKSIKTQHREVQAEVTLTQEAVDAFFTKFPCDQRATEYFNEIPREMQAAILRDFRPRSEGDSDYSAAMTSFIKYKQSAPWAGGKGGGGMGGKGGGAAQGMMPAQQFAGAGMQAGGPLTQQSVDAFFSRYPADQRACEYFSTCTVDVQTAVVQQFRPRQEGDADYSAALTAFIKRCMGGGQQQFAQQPQQVAQQPQFAQQQFAQQGDWQAAKRMRTGI